MNPLITPTVRRVVWVVMILFILGCSFFGTPNPDGTGGDSRQLPVETETEYSSPTRYSPPANVITATITLTERPTRTMTASPTEIENGIPFPDWVSDPSTMIFADISDAEKEIPQLLFLNVGSEEAFTFSLPAGISSYYWIDNMHLGMVSASREFGYVVDLSGGRVQRWEFSSEVTFLLYDEDVSLKILRSDNREEYILVGTYNLDFLSKTGKYSFSQERVENEWYLAIEETRTGESVWEIHSAPGGYVWPVQWSPSDDTIIAAVICRPSGTIDPNWGDMGLCDRFSIYDVSMKKQIFTQQADFGAFYWSPGGTRVLFLGRESRLGNLWVPFADPPCLLNLEDHQIQCLTLIKTTHIKHVYCSETTGMYQWGPDGKFIMYTVDYFDNDLLPHGPDGGLRGNLCLYDFESKSIRCPTESVEEMIGHSGFVLSISPDGKYSNFCLSSSGILGDYFLGGSKAVIGNDGTHFQLLPDQFTGDRSCQNTGLWRPLPEAA